MSGKPIDLFAKQQNSKKGCLTPFPCLFFCNTNYLCISCHGSFVF